MENFDYEKYVRQLYQDVSPYSIVILGPNGVLRRINTPFWVYCIKDVGELKIGDVVGVIAVRISFDLKMVYIINGKAYYYFNFRIKPP